MVVKSAALWLGMKMSIFCIEHILVLFGTMHGMSLAEDIARWVRVAVGVAPSKRIIFRVTVDVPLFSFEFSLVSLASSFDVIVLWRFICRSQQTPPPRTLTNLAHAHERFLGTIGNIGLICLFFLLLFVVVSFLFFFFFFLMLLPLFPLVFIFPFAATRRDASNVHTAHAARELIMVLWYAAPAVRVLEEVVVVVCGSSCHGAFFEGLGLVSVFVGFDIFRGEGEDGGGSAEHLGSWRWWSWACSRSKETKPTGLCALLNAMFVFPRGETLDGRFQVVATRCPNKISLEVMQSG